MIPRADAQQNAQAELGGCLHKSPNVAPPLKNELAAPLLVVDPKHIPVTILCGSTGIRFCLKPPLIRPCRGLPVYVQAESRASRRGKFRGPYTATESRPPAFIRSSCSRHWSAGTRARWISPEIGNQRLPLSKSESESARISSPVGDVLFANTFTKFSVVGGDGLAGSVTPRKEPVGGAAVALSVITAKPIQRMLQRTQ